jgi:hypothetical protein
MTIIFDDEDDAGNEGRDDDGNDDDNDDNDGQDCNGYSGNRSYNDSSCGEQQ